MPSPLKQGRRWAASRGGALLLTLLSRLPLPVARGLGRLLGTLAFHLARADRRRAEEQLRCAFGEPSSPGGHADLVRRVFRHLALTYLETLVYHRWGMEKTIERVPFEAWDELEKRIEEALAEGKGVIALSAHLGNWEMVGARGAATWGDRSRCIARRYDYEGYQRLAERIRNGLGIRLIYQDESPRSIVRLLRGNGILGILPDQDYKRMNGIFVDFFGRPAYTPTAPARLSLRTGASIVPVFLVREGRGYRAHVGETIRPEHARRARDPVRELTRLWSRAVEEQIRRFPEQWVWSHRRWRTTPEKVEYRRRKQRALEARRG
ncbi:MAG: lysophospholipid acyltransferase family protein [Planctomycetota bacterium]